MGGQTNPELSQLVSVIKSMTPKQAENENGAVTTPFFAFWTSFVVCREIHAVFSLQRKTVCVGEAVVGQDVSVLTC